MNSDQEFNPGDYIITEEGLRGYIVEKIELKKNIYCVRLTSGYVSKTAKELKIDPYQKDF